MLKIEICNFQSSLKEEVTTSTTEEDEAEKEDKRAERQRDIEKLQYELEKSLRDIKGDEKAKWVLKEIILSHQVDCEKDRFLDQLMRFLK